MVSRAFFVYCSNTFCTMYISAGKYALQPRHFAKLLGADSCTSDQIFSAIFDTDTNGLVDAFETM